MTHHSPRNTAHKTSTHETNSNPAKPKPSTLHPRNPHQGRYDFAKLTQALPELAKHTITNPSGDPTINFSDADAVLTLNKALSNLTKLNINTLKLTKV